MSPNIFGRFASLSLALFATAPAAAQSLTEAVQQALTTNPDVLAGVHERRAVYQEFRGARAGYFPSVDANLGIGRENTDTDNIDDVTLTRREAGIAITQMIYDGLLTASEVDRQGARVDSRAYALHGIAENTALRVAETYLAVLQRQELVEAARSNLSAHESSYDQIKLRSDSGVGRRSDLDQIEGRLALARTNLMAEEANLRDAETNFLRVVGGMPEALSAPEGMASVPPTLDETVKAALETHPTLKSAEADVAAAEAQQRAAKSAFSPRFDLELGANQNEDVDGIEGDDDDLSAMVRMRYNLFRGGRDQARMEETAHLIEQAKEIRNRTHRQVEEGTRLSWNAWQTSQEQLGQFRQHAESSERARDAYQKQFDIGQRTLLDLLDSENEVFSSKSDYINGRYNALFSAFRVLASQGRLVEALNVPLPEETRTLAAQTEAAVAAAK